MTRIIKLPRPARTSARVRITLVMHPKELAELEAKARRASMSLTSYFAALLASDDEDVLQARRQVLGEVLAIHKKRRKRLPALAGLFALATIAGCSNASCIPSIDASMPPDAIAPVDAWTPREGCAAYPAVDLVDADLEWLRAHTNPRVHGCGLHPLQREAPAALLEAHAADLAAVTECAPLWFVRDELVACVITWEGR